MNCELAYCQKWSKFRFYWEKCWSIYDLGGKRKSISYGSHVLRISITHCQVYCILFWKSAIVMLRNTSIFYQTQVLSKIWSVIRLSSCFKGEELNRAWSRRTKGNEGREHVDILLMKPDSIHRLPPFLSHPRKHSSHRLSFSYAPLCEPVHKLL